MLRKSQKYCRSIVAVALAAVLTSGPVGIGTGPILARPQGYTFTPIAFLDNPAPGGGNFTFDFEPYGINNRGEVAFVADLDTDNDPTTFNGEGVFIGRQGQILQIARSGQPAPGGGTFGPVDLGRIALNDPGDVVFAFVLEPLTLPLGLNSGVYRFSHSQQTLSAVVVPNVTPAPGGGTFAGVGFNHTSINNLGDVVFSGLVPGSDIAPSTPPGFEGLASGLFRADKHGNISSVVRPGDPAPGGGTFDAALNGWINEAGDIAFGAHVEGEECVDIGTPFVCAESVYLKDAATGAIQSIAHQGDPTPCGGVYRLAFGAVVNNRGDVVFIGDLTPPPGIGEALGVFLFSKGTTTAVACPGDPMPGGGTLVTATFQDSNYHLNNRGDVSFSATLDTDVNGDGIKDRGLYLFSEGSLSLVARTGTVIPGLGTIAYLGLAPFLPFPAAAGGIINERGQVLFFATLTDGRGVILAATPKP
jgi:hypothetical protein